MVSAFLAFVIKDGNRFGSVPALVPILLFWFLDGYYLALEQRFRDAFNGQMAKLRRNELTFDDLFTVKTDGKIPEHFTKAFFSLATWPVYLGLLFPTTLTFFL